MQDERQKRFYAHSLPGEPPDKSQPLTEHLLNVAEMAEIRRRFKKHL